MTHPAFRKRKTAQAKTAKAQQHVTKETADPEKLGSEDEDGFVTGPAPWRQVGCGACEGSGWSVRSGKFCRICVAASQEVGGPIPQQYEFRKSRAGVISYRALDDVVNGPVDIQEVDQPVEKAPNIPKPVKTPDQAAQAAKEKEAAPEKKEKRPPVDTRKADASAAAKKRMAASKKAEEERKAAKVSAPTGSELVLVLSGVVQKTDKKVVYLGDVLYSGKLGKRIAKELNAESFATSPPFGRRDAVKALAPDICKAVGNGVLVLDMGDTDQREVASAFCDFATTVIR